MHYYIYPKLQQICPGLILEERSYFWVSLSIVLLNNPGSWVVWWLALIVSPLDSDGDGGLVSELVKLICKQTLKQ
jgi:hypothetical protein